MPASVAFRKWDGMMPDTLAPPPMYAPTQRYAVVFLGMVVGVVVQPLGILPALLTGQTAVLSATLNVGDRV